MEGAAGDVVQKIELQSSVAVAPPCVVIQVLKIWAILLWLQLPLPPEAGLTMTGATLLKTVNVLWTLLELLQLSFAVKVTSITPQNEVMMAGEGALSESVITPH